jgi:hypothetical protein
MTPKSPPSSGKGARRGASSCSRTLLAAAASLLATSLATSPAHAGKHQGDYGSGNLAKGEIHTELYRGAAVPFEITVVETPNDCEGHLDLTIEWDEDDNEVVVELRGKEALEPFPSVDRTLGVDYVPNAFLPEPEDIAGGRYQLWLIAASGPMTLFFYDPITLDLIGSEHDFEVPPPAIPVAFPTLRMVGTPMFQPEPDGDVDETWTFDYDGMLRGDRPEFSHHLITFPPPNLCGANPYRLDQSTLRPYVTAPFPADEALPWSEYLRGGLVFDVTIEPPAYHMEPPLTTLTATYSGATAVGGGVPRGWTMDIEAAFMNVAPPIQPWAGAGTCESVYAGVHDFGLNVCGGAP